jgi:nitroimidazol reductase NimA-like FMN-containing flavoprotein (pyridoxamine 5'-phosphate oxidase superfamily)
MLILELTNEECIEMLTRLNFGRVGCSRDNQPYVVPFHFAQHDRQLYSVAAPGQKIEWMRANPLVCVEADEIINHDHWMSVVVRGRYEELPDTPAWKAERELAYSLLQRRNMWWEPACVRADLRVAVEQAIPIYYRIHIDQVTGRRARPDPVEAVALPTLATTSRCEGWLKSFVRRRRLVGPGMHAFDVHAGELLAFTQRLAGIGDFRWCTILRVPRRP